MNYQEFCKLWDDEVISFFELKTSGSTGKPKTIKLEKKWLEYSAKQTQKALGIKGGKIFCCIPTNKVGGFMMMVRAKVLKLDFLYSEPSSDPMKELDSNHNCTFLSLVPMQLKMILENEESKEKLDLFSHILIGGGPIDNILEEEIQEMKPVFYHTYAMTETYSHIALRRLNGHERQIRFYPLPEVKIRLNDEGCLQVSTAYAKNLNTTDLAVIFDDNSFKILGRADFAINTGGIKILPETVEKLISETKLISNNFAVRSLPDNILGEKIILIIEGEIQDSDGILERLKSILPKYHNPQSVFFVKKIPLTETGKIKRDELREKINRSFNEQFFSFN